MNQVNDILKQLNLSEIRLAQIGEFLETNQQDTEHTPWYMIGLVGASAWIAAILFTCFLFLAWELSTDSLIIMGIIPFGVALFINRLTDGSTFGNQLSLALGMTAQIIWDFEFLENVGPVAIWYLPLVGAAIFFAHTGRFHRFFTVANCLIVFEYLLRAEVGFAWSSALSGYFIDTLLLLVLVASVIAVSWIWTSLSPLKIKHRSDVFRPLGYGIVAATTFSLAAQTLSEYWLVGETRLAELSGMLILIVLSAQIFLISQKNGVNPYIGIVAAVVFLGFPAWRAPGVVWAILLLVLSWQRKDRLLLGISLVALAGFLSWFYYDLQISLLYKSYILFLSGLAMAGAYGLVNQFGAKIREVNA